MLAPRFLLANTLFCFSTEWKGRDDGLVAHVFFKNSHNFALSVFAFAVEGWLFYSAVNAIIPQIILHLGFETDAFIIGLRGLAVSGTAAVASALVTYGDPFSYAYRQRKADQYQPLFNRDEGFEMASGRFIWLFPRRVSAYLPPKRS